MANVNIACPFCNAVNQADEKYYGARFQCPNCGKQFQFTRDIVVGYSNGSRNFGTPAQKSMAAERGQNYYVESQNRDIKSDKTTLKLWFVLAGIVVAIIGVILYMTDKQIFKTASTKSTTQPLHVPKAGDTDYISLPNGQGLVMVYVEPGTFQMGTPPGETEKDGENEKQHQVTITKGYWISKYEITYEEWCAVMGEPPKKRLIKELPKVDVSWYDCQRFCEKAGNGLRLPTEAEWEFACRGGTKSRGYDYSGADLLQVRDVVANENVNLLIPCVGGSKLPNELGLYDMSGNVWEWCQDWYDEYPSGPVTDPTGPTSGKTRVCRGGSFYEAILFCTCAIRNGTYIPNAKSGWLGFRVCYSEEADKDAMIAKAKAMATANIAIEQKIKEAEESRRKEEEENARRAEEARREAEAKRAEEEAAKVAAEKARVDSVLQGIFGGDHKTGDITVITLPGGVRMGTDPVS